MEKRNMIGFWTKGIVFLAMISSSTTSRWFIDSVGGSPFLCDIESVDNRVHWNHFDYLREISFSRYVLISEKSILFIDNDESLYMSQRLSGVSIGCNSSNHSLCVTDQGFKIFASSGDVFVSATNWSEAAKDTLFGELASENCLSNGQGKGKKVQNEFFVYDVSACDISDNSMTLLYIPIEDKIVIRKDTLSFGLHIFFSLVIIVSFSYLINFYSINLSRSLKVVDNTQGAISLDEAYHLPVSYRYKERTGAMHASIQGLNGLVCFLSAIIIEMDAKTVNIVTTDDGIGILLLMVLVAYSLIKCTALVFVRLSLFNMDPSYDRLFNLFICPVHSFADLNVSVISLGVLVIYGTFDNPLRAPLFFIMLLRLWEKLFKNIHKGSHIFIELATTLEIFIYVLVTSFIIHHISTEDSYKTILQEMLDIIPLLVGAFAMAKISTLRMLEHSVIT